MGGLVFVAVRHSEVAVHDPTFLDKGVLALLALLLVLPLFREIEGFGFRFKRWEDLKREVRDDIRQELRLAATAQVINVMHPLNPDQLKALVSRRKEEVEAEVQRELPSLAADALTSGSPEVPASAKTVFEFTYPVMRELIQLWKQSMSDVALAFPPSLVHAAADMSTEGIISQPVMDLLRPLIRIDNVVRAGQDVSQDEVAYVKEVAPSVERWLRARRLAYQRANPAETAQLADIVRETIGKRPSGQPG